MGNAKGKQNACEARALQMPFSCQQKQVDLGTCSQQWDLRCLLIQIKTHKSLWVNQGKFMMKKLYLKKKKKKRFCETVSRFLCRQGNFSSWNFEFLISWEVLLVALCMTTRESNIFAEWGFLPRNLVCPWLVTTLLWFIQSRAFPAEAMMKLARDGNMMWGDSDGAKPRD